MILYSAVGAMNCPACRAVVHLDIPLGEYIPADSSIKSAHHVECNAGHAIPIEITVSQHSIEARLSGELNPVQVALHQRSIQPPNAPDGPGLVFEVVQEGLRSLIKDLAHKPNPMLHRMYLIQAVSNFEAYISDTLQGLSIRNPEVRLKIINSVDTLARQKASLANFTENPYLAMGAVQEHIKHASFQSLDSISQYLKSALGVETLPVGEERSFLHQMLEMRHDCVHRNGRTKTGAPIEDPLPHLDRLLTTLLEISERIRQRIYTLDRQGAEARILEMLRRFRELYATASLKDGMALGECFPLPNLGSVEIWFNDGMGVGEENALLLIWGEVLKIDDIASANLRGASEQKPVPDDWITILAMLRDISNEMVRTVASAINNQ